MAETIWRYKAIKPIRAEHPIGSGIIVVYEPGDDVPAGDWGASASWLVERDKIMRFGLNQYEDGHTDFDDSEVPQSPTDVQVTWDGAEEEFPKHDEFGPWYTLSNGDRVKGKQAAIDAEAALGDNDE